jgi:hypothetical protein
MEELKKIINQHFNINIDKVSRKSIYVFARGCYYKGCRDYLKLPLKAIGDSVNKDHATVLYSLRELPNIIKYDKILKKDYDIVMTKMKFFSITNEKLTAQKLVLKYNKLLFDNDILRGEINELNELIFILSEME